jgi:hypothetical protein
LRVYVTWPWSFDGKLGAPFRANIHTKRWAIMVGAKSQVQEKDGTWGGRWRRVTWTSEDPGIYARLHSTKRHSKFWSGKCACSSRPERERPYEEDQEARGT